jgi:hypothetical protein
MKIWTYEIEYDKNTKKFYKIWYIVKIGSQF